MRVARVLPLAVGAAAGVAVAIGMYLRRREELEYALEDRESTWTERRVREKLREDGHPDALRVSALTADIVEISGSVDKEEEAARIVDVVESVEGVRTVVNRLDVLELEARMSGNRMRYEDGDPELKESHWYGQRVGTGRRRQSASTDPDRPSDRVPMISRELGIDGSETDEVDLAGQERREPEGAELNTGARVAQETKPGVDRAIEEAGLKRRQAGDDAPAEGEGPGHGQGGAVGEPPPEGRATT